MARRRLRLIVSSGIAIWAVLLLALVPALMQVEAAWSADGITSICSAAAIFDAQAPDGSKTGSRDTHVFVHCPYCALQAHLVLPPDPRAQVTGMTWSARELPRRFLRAPRSAWIWSTAQPRAPPLA